MNVATVGVIGAGQMGTGIAQVFARAEYEVILMDPKQESLGSAILSIDGNLEKQIRRQKIERSQKDAVLSFISTTSELSSLGSCDLVIEAATEEERIKREIYVNLEAHLRPDTVLCSNTSSISITRLAGYTRRPERFMGLHFMNPVPAMPLVELIRGIGTSQTTFDLLQEVVNRLGKQVISAEDFPAFIVNRVLIPMINEAIFVVYEGVGTIIDTDLGMKLGANHPMGPLELADFIGLDTCLAIMNVLYDGLADTKYRPCPLLVKYVEAGWLGRKVGRGFYDYSGDKPVPTR